MTPPRHQPPERVGVCVVRADQQPDGLLITVSTTPDIERDEMSRTVVQDAGAALATVSAFLEDFQERS